MAPSSPNEGRGGVMKPRILMTLILVGSAALASSQEHSSSRRRRYE
jgi:hypothetical protein